MKDIIDDTSKFSIPTFQRSLVWSIERKKNFIKVLRKGDPIGVILVYEKGGKFRLIDGLQRISTIKAYSKNPMKFLDLDDISDKYIFSIIKHDFKSKGITYSEKSADVQDKFDRIKKIVQAYFISTAETGADYLATALYRKLIAEAEVVQDLDIGESVERLIKDFTEETDISKLQIFAIIYKGPEENLPEVFFNLNTGSVPLSPYEVLASSWQDANLKIKDKDILDKIKEKYKNIEKLSGMETEFAEEDLEEGITLFEYCSAISELVFAKDSKHDFSMLVGERDKKSTSPFAFEILSLVCGNNVNQAAKLKENLSNCTQETLIKLKNSIIDILTHIKSDLEKYLIDANGNSLRTTSVYQIYHIFVAYFKSKYNFIPNANKIEEIGTWKSTFDMFRKYLYKHYLFDEITNFWQKNRQTQDLTKNIVSDELLLKYKYDIAKDKWASALKEWMDSQLNVGVNVPKDNRLFLHILHVLGLRKNPLLVKYFKSEDDDTLYIDVEHIVPKKLFDTLEKKKMPVSHVANLCYLVCKDNRGKREKTLYEDESSRPSYVLDQEFLQFVLYPSKEELGFVHFSDNDFCEQYKTFIEERSAKLISRFVELV